MINTLPYLLRRNIFYIFIITCQLAASQDVLITVHPSVNTAIDGQLTLNRNKYFNISASGKNFESVINNSARSNHYITDLKMTFGRSLGLVKWNNLTFEDPTRPGFANLNYIATNARPSNGIVSSTFLNAFPLSMDIACHDGTEAYPAFMPQTTTTEAGNAGKLPNNTQAAAELAVALLKYNFTEWMRPTTFEPINEPHWSINNTLLANFHLAVWQRAKDENIKTLVGGPCMSVPYFYNNNYQYFSNLSKFIDNTQCKLDFYSFHTYDFMKWDNTLNDIKGRVSSGLPLEGVLDLVPNYTVNKYGKSLEMVFSEHGGYFLNSTDATSIANKYFPGSGFEWEMKKRSINEFVMVNSAITNTMVFMNHPHSVLKAVPFIILESFDWDKYYYSSLLVANNFTDKANWQESKMIYFYEFFKDIEGRRVESECSNPDIQQQAFVKGNKLFLVLNNLSNSAEKIKFNLPVSDLQSIQLRRFGKNVDFTPYLTEVSTNSLDLLQLNGHESMVIEMTYETAFQADKQLNIKPYYGNAVTQQFIGAKDFIVNIPTLTNLDYAYLRVGISRTTGTNRLINIKVNGISLTVPIEKCATYIEEANGSYATTKIIKIDKSLLSTSNTISVSFADGNAGGVGAVVLRCAYNETVSAVEQIQNRLFKVFPNPTKKDYVSVELPEVHNNVQVKLYNLNGELLDSNKYMSVNNIRVDLHNAKFKGLYFLKINADNVEYNHKLSVTE